MGASCPACFGTANSGRDDAQELARVDSRKVESIEKLPVAPNVAEDSPVIDYHLEEDLPPGKDFVTLDEYIDPTEEKDIVIQRRFQVLLGKAWTDLDDEVLSRLNAALQKGATTVEVESRGMPYRIDISNMTQINTASGKTREIREVDATGTEICAETAAEYINSSVLGPPCSPFAKEQPDWQWDTGKDGWRSYPLHESIELDRYWQAYIRSRDDGSDSKAVLAQMKLSGKAVVVDFQRSRVTIAAGQPKDLRRQLQKCDWLSNLFFWDAFRDVLSAGGVDVTASPEEIFDFRFNQDFRNMKDTGRVLSRGGHSYKIPVGWKRFAVNVKGQYDSGDNSWLREDDTGWAVAYHGTAKESLPGILCTGFRVGDRQKFDSEVGKGVYCASKINVAQHYSQPKEWKGQTVQIVLQLRVRPSAIKSITSGREFEKLYWVINDPKDIRAYGVLIRELPLDRFVSALEAVYGPEQRPKELPPLLKEVYDSFDWSKSQPP